MVAVQGFISGVIHQVVVNHIHGGLFVSLVNESNGICFCRLGDVCIGIIGNNQALLQGIRNIAGNQHKILGHHSFVIVENSYRVAQRVAIFIHIANLIGNLINLNILKGVAVFIFINTDGDGVALSFGEPAGLIGFVKLGNTLGIEGFAGAGQSAASAEVCHKFRCIANGFAGSFFYIVNLVIHDHISTPLGVDVQIMIHRDTGEIERMLGYGAVVILDLVEPMNEIVTAVYRGLRARKLRNKGAVLHGIGIKKFAIHLGTSFHVCFCEVYIHMMLHKIPFGVDHQIVGRHGRLLVNVKFGPFSTVGVKIPAAELIRSTQRYVRVFRCR